MTIDELRERIKNQIVLHDGDLADWQWPATGLPEEATELGITDFRRLVNDVSRQLNSYFGRILDLKDKITAQARQQQKKLSNGDIEDIIKEAERLTLSRGFVADQWIPVILKAVPEPVAGGGGLPAQPSALSATPAPESVPNVSSAEISQKVKDILDDYDRHIPVLALRTLFRAIGGDEAALAEVVRAYLAANFFSAEKEPTGQTLKEKLLSTDWRHLSWWETNAAPVVTAVSAPAVAPGPQPNGTQSAPGHPMVDRNYQTPPPPAQSVKPSRPPQRTNLSGLWGVLFALVFLLIVYVMIKGGGKNQSSEGDERVNTEQPEAPAKNKTSQKKRRKKKNELLANERSEEVKPATQSKQSQVEPDYEELRDEVGQYNEQPAKKNGRWGLWRNEKWMIKPIYDEVSVFEEGRASVRLGSASFDIDRYGNKVVNR